MISFVSIAHDDIDEKSGTCIDIASGVARVLRAPVQRHAMGPQ